MELCDAHYKTGEYESIKFLVVGQEIPVNFEEFNSKKAA